jgi:ferredoxin
MCPDKFEVGEDNVAHVKDGDCGCDINDIVSSCPVEAIKIED